MAFLKVSEFVKALNSMSSKTLALRLLSVLIAFFRDSTMVLSFLALAAAIAVT
jgi:hypothetical protein